MALVYLCVRFVSLFFLYLFNSTFRGYMDVVVLKPVFLLAAP